MPKSVCSFVFWTILIFVVGENALADSGVLDRPVLEVVRETQSNLAQLSTVDRDQALRILDFEFTKFYTLEAKKFDLVEVKKYSKEITETLFQTRLALRDNVHRYSDSQNQMDETVLNATKRVMRALRNVEDQVGEVMVDFVTVDDSQIKRVFADPSPWTLLNPKFESPTIQSGDVMAARGKVAVSAAIARIGDEDYQFSHTAILHENSGDKKWYVVEALIEKGLVNHDIERALQGPGRFALYRLRPSVMEQYPELDMTSGELARRAGEVVFARGKDLEDNNEILPYNFAMTLEPYNELFCAQVVRMGYDLASGGAIKIPKYLSKMSQRNRGFLKRIGVTVDETYAPGDIDFDPRFELVAEWRDFRVTPKLRMLDYVLTSIYTWMERDNWKFKESFWVRTMAHAVKNMVDSPFSIIRNIPYQMGHDVPSFMTLETLVAVQMLNDTVYELYGAATEFAKDTLARTGYPATPREIYQYLEDYKAMRPKGLKYLKP